MFLSSSRFASFSIIAGCFRLPDILGCSRLVLDSFHVPSFSDVPFFIFALAWSSPSSSRFASYSIYYSIMPGSVLVGRKEFV